MAGSLTAYGEQALLELLLSDTAATIPATWYVALSTAAFTTSATGAALSEVTGGGYARQSLANSLTNFPVGTGSNPRSKSNGIAVPFPTATANWGTVLSAYLVDAASGGNAWLGGDLAAGIVVNTGGSITIGAGQWTFTAT